MGGEFSYLCRNQKKYKLMKFRFISLLLIGAMMVSCDEFGNLILPDEGDKENTENTGGENNGENNGDNTGGNNENTGNEDNKPSGDPLTPEESRVKLEEVGAELTELLDPSKQAELLEVIDRFYLYSDNLVMEYDSAAAVNAANATKAAKAYLAPMKAIANGSVKAASSLASVQETWAIGLDGALGIYAHDGAEWIYTKSTEKLEFRFMAGGDDVVINVTPSGEKYSYKRTYIDERYDGWDDQKEEPIYIEVEYTDIISIPGKVKATVTKGAKTLADLEINGVYKVGGNPVSSDVKLEMGPYEVTVDADLNTTALTNKLNFAIDGKPVFNSETEVKGTFNLDPDFYMDFEGIANDYIYDYIVIDDLKFTNEILDLKIAVTAKDSKDIETKIRNLEKTINDYESRKELEPEGIIPYSISQDYVSKMCAIINDAADIEASYGDSPIFAKVEMKAIYSEEVHYYDEYFGEIDYDEDGIIDEEGYDSVSKYIPGYEMAPVLVFEDDGASFSMAEFFNRNDFTNVIEDFDNLGELYGNCLPNIWADFEAEVPTPIQPGGDYEEEPMN